METMLRTAAGLAVILAAPLASGGNSTLYRNQNNVKGQVGGATVLLLGQAATLSGCEALCIAQDANASVPCHSFTWHHPDFAKPQYASHCYGRTDMVWAPVAQEKIDSGLRFAPPPPPPSPPPTPAGWVCSTDAVIHSL